MTALHRVWRQMVALQVCFLRGCEQRFLCCQQPLSLTEEDAVLYPMSVLPFLSLHCCSLVKNVHPMLHKEQVGSGLALCTTWIFIHVLVMPWIRQSLEYCAMKIQIQFPYIHSCSP